MSAGDRWWNWLEWGVVCCLLRRWLAYLYVPVNYICTYEVNAISDHM